jgi:hypothetical protein
LDLNEIREKLLLLIEHGIYKTTAQLVEELRIEYPVLWRNLEKEGEILYGQSCSSMQQPATRISQVLLSLPADCCQKQKKGKIYYWSKP